MHKHAPMLKGLLIGLFLFPFISWGQIEVEETLGEICSDGYCVEITVSGFTPVDETPFEDDPYYAIYVEYGDGYFETRNTPNANSAGFAGHVEVFEHTYVNSSGSESEKGIKIRITPVKMDDPIPSTESLIIEVPITTNEPDDYPEYINDSLLIGIMASWDLGIKVEDDLTVMVGKNNNSPSTGILSLHFREEFFDPINPIDASGDPTFGRYKDPGSPVIDFEIDMEEGDGYYDKMIQWDYKIDTKFEYLIFTDLQSTGDIINEQNVYLLATLKERRESEEIIAQKTLILEVDASRDPNSMFVVPKEIEKNSPPNELVYTINFYNEGSAPVDKITVTSKLPAEVDPSTFEHISATIRRGESVSLGDNATGPDLTVNGSEIIDGVTDNIEWTFTNANLLGVDQGLVDPRYSEGQIVFKVKTKENLDCTSFKTNATIEFVNAIDPIRTTEDAIVNCIETENGFRHWCLIYLIILGVFLVVIWLLFPPKSS